jgi:hypothetical protein
VVLLAPGWARAVPSETWSPPARAAYARYARYVGALVARYKPGGSFWLERPDLRPMPIRAWQIWNEPNGPRFWTVQPGLAQYVALLRATRAAVKRADPRAKVVLAGLTDRSWISLKRLYRLGMGASADMIALNPFSAEPRNVVRLVRRARAVMRRNGDARKPLLVTETSWPSARGRVVAPFGYEQTEVRPSHGDCKRQAGTRVRCGWKRIAPVERRASSADVRGRCPEADRAARHDA